MSAENDLKLSREEVINCAISSWYQNFKSVTFKSVFITLSQDFIDYLHSDGCVLPQGCSLPSVAMDDTDSDIEVDDQINWDDDENTALAPCFPELLQTMKQAIDDLGGVVLPKLNWSSPKDAVWIVSSNSLRCTCPAEVILLLKSSNFVAHDLTRVFEYCCNYGAQANRPFTYQLCLRRWENFHPSAEFRCFVYSSKLIGISQRNHTASYKHLLESKDNLCAEIVTFFSNEIAGKFPNNNYVFDICRIKANKFWLVDFNPYCPMTDALLFSWDELSLGPKGLKTPSTDPNRSSTQVHILNLPDVRLVDGLAIQPSDLQSCRLPKDIVDLASGEDIHKFADLFMKSKLPGQESDSD